MALTMQDIQNRAMKAKKIAHAARLDQAVFGQSGTLQLPNGAGGGMADGGEPDPIRQISSAGGLLSQGLANQRAAIESMERGEAPSVPAPIPTTTEPQPVPVAATPAAPAPAQLGRPQITMTRAILGAGKAYFGMANGGVIPDDDQSGGAQYMNGGKVCPHGMGRACPTCYANGGDIRPGDAEDNIPIKVSANEVVLPGDTVRAIGKKKVLDTIAATHTPIKGVFGHANGYFPGTDGYTVEEIPDIEGTDVKPPQPSAPRRFAQPSPEARAYANRPAYQTAAPAAEAPAAAAPAAAEAAPAAEGIVGKAYKAGSGLFGKAARFVGKVGIPLAGATALADTVKEGSYVSPQDNLLGQAGAVTGINALAPGAGDLLAKNFPNASAAVGDAAVRGGRFLQNYGNRLTFGLIPPATPSEGAQAAVPSTAPVVPSTQNDVPSTPEQVAAAQTRDTLQQQGVPYEQQSEAPVDDLHRGDFVRSAQPDTKYHNLGDYGDKGTQIFGRASEKGGKINDFVGVGGGQRGGGTGYVPQGVDFGLPRMRANGTIPGSGAGSGYQTSPEYSAAAKNVQALSDRLADMPPGTLMRGAIMRQLADARATAEMFAQQDARRNTFGMQAGTNAVTAQGNKYAFDAKMAEVKNAQAQAAHQWGLDAIKQTHDNLDSFIKGQGGSDADVEQARALAATMPFQTANGQQKVYGLPPEDRAKAFAAIRNQVKANNASGTWGYAGSYSGKNTTEPGGIAGALVAAAKGHPIAAVTQGTSITNGHVLTAQPNEGSAEEAVARVQSDPDVAKFRSSLRRTPEDQRALRAKLESKYGREAVNAAFGG